MVRKILTVLLGVGIFIGAFFLSSTIINALIAGIDDKDTRVVIKIILWFLFFPITAWLGMIGGGLAAYLLNKKL